ncbi:MAG: response regulator [Betaproteobacteria bacterium]|nr:response regulator [Betaproteobacteria bacterium]
MNTDSGDNEYFDLPTLLKQSCLNTRIFAATEPTLSVGEYFGMVSKLLSLAPNVSSALIKFAHREGDKEACKSLDSIIALLEKFGCTRFILDFHSLLNAYGKQGNWREAATYARQIEKDFNAFCLRVMAAKRRASAFSYPGDPSLNAFPALNEIPLGEFIKNLDDEEASRRLLILAVDDSPVILKTVSSVLDAEYKVFTLAKPSKLKEVLQKLTPELFLLDYKMPELTGFELIPIIRGFEEHKETPIIFLTSIGTIDNVSAALALGACDFIVKPFNPCILREKIKKHIVRKKMF